MGHPARRANGLLGTLRGRERNKGKRSESLWRVPLQGIVAFAVLFLAYRWLVSITGVQVLEIVDGSASFGAFAKQPGKWRGAEVPETRRNPARLSGQSIGKSEGRHAAKASPGMPSAPKIFGISLSHGPQSGGSSVFILGEGFGEVDTHPVVYIGGGACQDSRWISNTAVQCIVPPGTGILLPVHVTICGCSSGAELKGQATTHLGPVEARMGASPVTFSYDEDVIQASAGKITQGLKITVPLNFFPESRTRVRGAAMQRALELSGTLPNETAPRYASCSVVGTSASLTGSRLGMHIDSADAIFRVNNAPIRQWKRDVGSRTTYQVMNPFFARLLAKSDIKTRAAALGRWHSNADGEFATLVAINNGRKSTTQSLELLERYPSMPILALNVGLHKASLAIAKTIGSSIADITGRWYGQFAGVSTTFITTLLAMQMCDSVSLYGVDPRGNSSSYFVSLEDERRSRSANEELEYLLYLVFKAEGLISDIDYKDGVSLGRRQKIPVPANYIYPFGHRGCAPNVPICTPSCSGHGMPVVDGGCECEPMYRGSDCSINLLEQHAEEIMAGIESKWGGPLLLSQEVLDKSSEFEFPRAIARPPMQLKGMNFADIYKMLPRRSTLPRRYGSCALVGSSGRLLEQSYGREIDAHELVYRFNQAPTKGFEHNVGARTSMNSVNGKWVRLLTSTRRNFRWKWREQNTTFVMLGLFEPMRGNTSSAAQVMNRDKWWRQAYHRVLHLLPSGHKLVILNPLFISWSYLLYADLQERIQGIASVGEDFSSNPMSGFYAFTYLLQVCDRLDMYGFQPWIARKSNLKGHQASRWPYHYYYDQNCEDPDQRVHSFNLAMYIYELFSMKHSNLHIFP